MAARDRGRRGGRRARGPEPSSSPDPGQRIGLVTEGGYPFGAGGVSVWCDQLVRGMPERRFALVTLTGAAQRAPVYDLPDNVASVTALPLWTPLPRRRPPRGRHRDHFLDLYRLLLQSALAERAPAGAFGTALRGLYEFAQSHDLSAAVCTDDALRVLVDCWTATPPGADAVGEVAAATPTMGDAALVTLLLEHMLRPLTLPPLPVDLVHAASNGLAGLVALCNGWATATPYVVSEHGVYLRERYLAYRETSYGWPVKWTLLRITRALTAAIYAEAQVVVPGNVYNRRWQVRGGADPDSIVTVYNGVDPGEFRPSGQEPVEPTLVFVGRIDPLKDVETLVRAFALVHEDMPEARLRIFGVPAPQRRAYLDRCRDLAASLPLDGMLGFEGRAPTALEAYAAGHVVVLTSISEGFPYTVIEAMSTGRATVSTDVGGVSEAVGDAGLVVPPRDPPAVAEACLSLLRDDARREELGAAARQRVLDMFTLERSMSAFRSVYESVWQESRAVQPEAAGTLEPAAPQLVWSA